PAEMSTNAAIELALDRVDWRDLAAHADHLPRVYTPGEVLMPEAGFMRGHGTFVEDENIKASVAGVIQKVNKLISSRYVGEIGDVVVARVSEVQQKRWRVDTNSRLDSILLLSSVNLPGGELRRRSAEDEQMMRRYLDEGDLISAEVQNIFEEGTLSLYTRSLKYGKLSQGILVKVFPALVKRRKMHFHNLPCGASVILGNNGYIWISPTKGQEQEGGEGGFAHIPRADREVIARLRNSILALAKCKLMIYDTSIQYAYEESLKYEAHELLQQNFVAVVAMAEKLEAREALMTEKKVCRFCLTEQKLASIFEENARVKTTANLPLQIMAITAIEMCKRAETLLRQYPLTGNWPSPLEKPRAPMMTVIPKKVVVVPAPVVETLENPKKLLNTMAKSSQIVVENVQVLETSLVAQNPVVENNQELSMDDVQNMLEDMANELDKEMTAAAPKPSPKKPKVLNKSSIRILNKGPAAPVEPRIATPQVKRDESGNVAVVTEVLDLDYHDDPTKNTETVATNVFPCPDCERSFPLQQLLEIHQLNHTRSRSFQCPHCEKSFFSKYDLAKHNFRPFKCTICGKAFTRKALLHRHERTHTEIPKIICVYCEKQFISRQEMEKHAERHKKKRPFKCGVCSKAFAFKQGLERHEVVHSTNLPFPCQHCPRSFSTASKLARHLVAHAGKRAYPCKYCPKSYLLSHHLSRHLRMHTQTSDAMFVCSECKKSFTSYNSLLEHASVHANATLKCPMCREQIEDIDSVDAHMEQHKESERFACEFCDHIFLTQNCLQKHIEDDHVIDMEPYQVDEEGEGEEHIEEDLDLDDVKHEEFEAEYLDEDNLDDDHLDDSDESFTPPTKQRKIITPKGVETVSSRQTRSRDTQKVSPKAVAVKKDTKSQPKLDRFVVKNRKSAK
ncbi:hypothetical protein M5D96_008801, partial [Drosophila gunungcola]